MYDASRTSGFQTNYENPEWAPLYIDGERYLYLPDIESYYDLATREFVFLYHGQWRYSRELPSWYDNFDLQNCFVIVLSTNVYQPWLLHQYYLSHYPRYYYRDYYDRSNIPYVRGFDENQKRAIYWKESERNRARDWNNENQVKNRQFKYTKEDRQQQRIVNKQGTGNTYHDHTTINNNPQKNQGNNANQTGNPRGNSEKGQAQDQNRRTNRTSVNVGQQGADSQSDKTHETNYYGKTIGTPVKVEKQMRNQSAPKSPNSSNDNDESIKRSNPGRR